MQAVSAGYLTAWRNGGTRLHRVLVDSGAGFAEVSFTSFQVDAARGERVVSRYSGNVVLPPGVAAVDADGAFIRLQAGFLINDQPEYCTLATLRVEEVEDDDSGAQHVSGFSVERAVEVAGFEVPTVLDMGTGVTALRQLLAFAATPVTVTATRDRLVPTSVFESSSSPWEAVQYYTQALSVEVHADPLGGLIISDPPSLSAAPVITVDEGGVQVGRRRRRSRTGVPSVVVVEGNRTTNTATPTPRGVVRDENPYSRTYYAGRFGRQQKNVSSPSMLDNTQCLLSAATILADSQGLARALTVDSVPMDFLEPGDVVTFAFLDGTAENHIIDSLRHSSDDSRQQLATRTAGAVA